MKLVVIVFAIIAFLVAYLFGSTTGTIIQGGQVKIKGGYLAFGPSQTSVAISTSTTGQCIGILCGVTKAN